jgi:hypothetical protein
MGPSQGAGGETPSGRTDLAATGTVIAQTMWRTPEKNEPEI